MEKKKKKENPQKDQGASSWLTEAWEGPVEARQSTSIKSATHKHLGGIGDIRWMIFWPPDLEMLISYPGLIAYILWVSQRNYIYKGGDGDKLECKVPLLTSLVVITPRAAFW